MIAIKVECMEHMPSDCDFCYWFGTRPHPYKGWTDICELTGHCMDDDQPEEWIYSGDGRPKACPLIEVADRKTENNSEETNNSTISKMEQVDEPQTQLTAKCLECNNSKACKENHWEDCRYEPLGYEVTAVVGTIKDEPQTDCAWR